MKETSNSQKRRENAIKLIPAAINVQFSVLCIATCSAIAPCTCTKRLELVCTVWYVRTRTYRFALTDLYVQIRAYRPVRTDSSVQACRTDSVPGLPRGSRVALAARVGGRFRGIAMLFRSTRETCSNSRNIGFAKTP